MEHAATPISDGLSETRDGHTVAVPLAIESAGSAAVAAYLDAEFAALTGLTADPVTVEEVP